jgi:hypothetical protein
MSESSNTVSLFKRADIESESREILDELREVKSRLAQAYRDFNNTLEPTLIESCVFEINALQSRYGYLLRRAKELGSTQVEVFRFPRNI